MGCSCCAWRGAALVPWTSNLLLSRREGKSGKTPGLTDDEAVFCSCMALPSPADLTGRLE